MISKVCTPPCSLLSVGVQVSVVPLQVQNEGRLVNWTPSCPQTSTPSLASMFVVRGISSDHVSRGCILIWVVELIESHGSAGESQSKNTATLMRTNHSSSFVIVTYRPVKSHTCSCPALMSKGAELHLVFAKGPELSPTLTE